MVNRVVPFEELDVVVDETAARLAAGPQSAIRKIKQALNESALPALAAALEKIRKLEAKLRELGVDPDKEAAAGDSSAGA